MKKLIVLILCILIVAVVGFGLKLSKNALLGSRYVCNFEDRDVYVKDGFYYFDNNGESYVYAHFGIYKEKPEKDGWQLKLFVEGYETSVHYAYTQWIENRKTGTGTAIDCQKLNDDVEFPPTFKKFIDTHKIIFKIKTMDAKELEALKNSSETLPV